MTPCILRIHVEFLGTATFSGHAPSGAPEWPPSPARVFSALVAGAGASRTPTQDAALCTLESTAAPVIISAGDLKPGPRIPHYINRADVAVPATGRVDQVLQRRLLGARLSEVSQMPVGTGGEATPFGDHVVVTDGVDYLIRVTDEHTSMEADALSSALDEIAAQVTYLGRSTDQASLTVTDVTDTVGGEEPHLLHGFAASLVGETGRVVWVPSARPRSVLSGWTPGLLSALDVRHAGELEGAVYPHPAYLTPQIYYRPVVGGVAPAQTSIAVAHLEDPLTGLKAGRLLDIIPTGACAMFAPGGSDSTRSRVAHVAVTGDANTLPERMEALDTALRSEAYDFEWDPDVPVLARHYLSGAVSWSTVVPASGFGPAAYAAAVFAADIEEQTGIDAELLTVTAVPASDQATRVHRPSVGGRLWDVTVSSQVPLKGPLRIGDTTGGILVRADFTTGTPTLRASL